MPVTFQHIISLGSDCDVSLQLRRIGWHQTPSVFDWLVTPWDAMMGVLSDGGAQLAQDFYPSHRGEGAACGAYHLVYWHEFPRDGAGQVQVTESAIARTRQKMAYKMERMRAVCLSGGCVLFVRAGLITDAPGDRFAAGQNFTMAELDRCVALIAGLYPKLRFSLLFIDYPGRDRLDERLPAASGQVIRYTLPLAPPDAGRSLTKSSNAAWDAVWTQVPYQR